jgi:quercetin dioxygenase-like cupin family protein
MGSASGAYALGAGEGWVYEDVGYTFEIKLRERSGPSSLAVTVLSVTEDEWPGHTHRGEDETFYVLEGSVTFRCGDDEFEVDAGGFVFLPTGVQHGYKLRSPHARFLVATVPARDGEKPGWGGFISDFEDECDFRAAPATT